jgi:hypothetical protein
MPSMLNTEPSAELQGILGALTNSENQPHQWIDDPIALEIALIKAFTPIVIAHLARAIAKEDA